MKKRFSLICECYPSSLREGKGVCVVWSLSVTACIHTLQTANSPPAFFSPNYLSKYINLYLFKGITFIAPCILALVLSTLATGEVNKPTYKISCGVYCQDTWYKEGTDFYVLRNRSDHAKKGKRQLASLKGVHACSIPSCENVIQQKIHGSNFVAVTWHATCDEVILKEPLKGWKLVTNAYQTAWFQYTRLFIQPTTTSDADSRALIQLRP